MASKLKQLQSVKIWDLEPEMVAKQIVGQVSQISFEEKISNNNEKIKYVKGLIGDETGCIEFRLV